MQKKSDIENLFRKYIENKCNPEEADQLLSYFGIPGNEDVLKELIEKYFELNNAPDSAEYREILDRVYHDIQEEINLQKEYGIIEPKIIPIYKRKWFRLSAAAVLVLGLSFLGYNTLNKKDRNERDTTIAKTEVEGTYISPDIYSTELKLDNGTVINLDKAENGKIMQSGNIIILKENEKIVYKKIKADLTEVNSKYAPVYTTVSTRNGKESHIVLEDGTEVWLNAASSISFPMEFSASERKVRIKGEAYFEVTKNPLKPFRVQIDSNSSDGEIEVLGTHFNVSAYPGEEVKTTLLEGSVKIKRDNETKMLYPGDQASYSQGKISVEKNVDVNQVMAWKQGLFIFNNADIKTIMNQMARWYDVEVIYKGKITAEGFTGKIYKSLPLLNFLKIIKLNGVKIKLEGKKVIVME
ncbi:MAG: FecR domain-containing protein [Chitinophagales bacterium]|nr:FecR domain-containing protein [Chitinophagales bacterium]